MGKKPHHPRRGSLGYSPRKRVKREVPRIKSWASEDKVRMQGFSGYKAGTTHVFVVDERPHSHTKGEEIVETATVIEVPSMRVCGIRAYGETSYGARALMEVWEEEPNKDLARAFPYPKKKGMKKGLAAMEKALEKVKEIRLIVHTLPRKSALPKKKPEVMEYLVGGSVEEAFTYAKEHLGKDIRFSDIFEEGEIVDTVSVTKGKGFQSPVKRWGVKLQPRKTRGVRRKAGNLGPWHPSATMWRVPQCGQMGYHQRTEYNKRVLGIGEDGTKITPKGGFLRYGEIKGDYVIISGSTPGPQKRLIRLRPAISPPTKYQQTKPEVTYLSTRSKQGLRHES